MVCSQIIARTQRAAGHKPLRISDCCGLKVYRHDPDFTSKTTCNVLSLHMYVRKLFSCAHKFQCCWGGSSGGGGGGGLGGLCGTM